MLSSVDVLCPEDMFEVQEVLTTTFYVGLSMHRLRCLTEEKKFTLKFGAA
jgi:hypothetical protein